MVHTATLVFGDFRDGAYAGGGIAAQLLLDCHEIVPQQLENFFCRRYRQCAQSSPVPVLYPTMRRQRLAR
jgi:hypothetical protein